MAATATATTEQPLATPADQILDPSKHAPYAFGFSDFLQREFRFGLNPERPICEAFKKGHCPNDNCPDKHYTKANYTNLICKHWLRGLCKKGAACEFLHEYNLRDMPECIQYSRYQLCVNGAECLYLHIDPIIKAAPCEHFERGFCPLGPACGARHVKRASVCPHYLAGFCPDGPSCTRGAHPPWKEKDQMSKPKVKVVLSDEEEAARQERMRAQMDKDEEEESRKFVDRGTYNQQKMQGRGRGGKRYRRGRGGF